MRPALREGDPSNTRDSTLSNPALHFASYLSSPSIAMTDP